MFKWMGITWVHSSSMDSTLGQWRCYNKNICKNLNVLSAAIVWNIWLQRNKIVFEGEYVCWRVIANKAIVSSSEWWIAAYFSVFA